MKSVAAWRYAGIHEFAIPEVSHCHRDVVSWLR